MLDALLPGLAFLPRFAVFTAGRYRGERSGAGRAGGNPFWPARAQTRRLTHDGAGNPCLDHLQALQYRRHADPKIGAAEREKGDAVQIRPDVCHDSQQRAGACDHR